ncbi:uncharacterized protein EV154DRAFT_496665 [Mucor mucedo]|uniref:uncharacterized protein n=1 Tax=Mucor mucedo TaxID=29922 RepID=UPI00221EE292|nr:uncharacterized protein EV154DRAFT_496665 [Mucor mucedo]KAI7894997.1 hypothetical protein EV154DRAFT_496665 [Mucor mucedo]
MSNWGSLPAEILAEIIDLALNDYSTKGTFKLHCLLICKHWSLVGRTIIYKNVILDKEDQFEPFVASMLNSPNGQFVKDVSLLYNEENQLEFGLSQFFEACPNLTMLSTRSRKKSSFYAKLLSELVAGNGINLKSIPANDCEDLESFRAYGYATLVLKDTLQGIFFSDYHLDKSTFYQNEALNRLGIFKNLEWISLRLEDHSNVFKIFEKMQCCPSLTSVYIATEHPELATKKDRNIAEPFNLQPLTNVSKVEISELITPTTRLIQYIMHLFPNATSLELTNNRGVFPCLQQQRTIILNIFEAEELEISTELWIQLFKYIAPMKICELPALFIKNYREVFLRVPNLCEHLEILYEKEFWPDAVEIEPHVSVYHNQCFDGEICTMHPIGNHSRRAVFKCFVRSYFQAWPHEAVIKTLGRNLKALDVHVSPAAEIGIPGTGLEIKAETDLFDLIFEYCPRLDTLWVEDGTFDHLNLDSSCSLQFLELIQFTSCNFDPIFLRKLSAQLPRHPMVCIFIRCTSKNLNDTVGPFTLIDMPDTSFNYLSWKSNLFGGRNPIEETLYLKITKHKALPCYYKVSAEFQLFISSSEDFEASKNNLLAETIDIRCFDIKKLIFKRSKVHFVLYLEKEPVILDEERYACLRIFSKFHDD